MTRPTPKSSRPLPRRSMLSTKRTRALILEITAAIQAPGRGRKKIASVEAAARKAASAVMPTDPEAARTLFTLAELLALARD
jgi:hypothetical protein